MNPLIQQIANQKLNSLTKEELLSLSMQYGVPITYDQAEKVILILRSETIDIANKQQVERLLYRLQTEIDPYVSNTVKHLLNQYAPLLKSFGYQL